MEFNYSKPTLEVLSLLAASTRTKDFEPLTNYLVENEMHPLYLHFTKTILPYDALIAQSMQQANSKYVNETLNTKNLDNETECFEIDLKVSEYYASILDTQNFIATSKQIMRTNASSSLKMDIMLCKIRIAIIYGDKRMIREAFEEGEDIISRGCDWDRRNKFKAYSAFYHLLNKQYTKSGACFYEALATFKSGELISYEKCVFYLLFSAVLTFERSDLNEKILKSSDVLETINVNSKGIKLVNCVYHCDYNSLIESLIPFLDEINNDIFLNGQIDFFVREVKVKIYKQLLESYRSLSIDLFCDILRVSDEYVERDLCDFITDQRLDCVIDRVHRIVHVKEKVDLGDAELVNRGEQLMRFVQKNVK